METLGDKNMPKICSKYACLVCDYNTSKKSSYVNHINTKKHKMITGGFIMGQKYAEIMPENMGGFCCSCGKQYIHRQGLWRHKKSCVKEEKTVKKVNEEKEEKEEKEDADNGKLIEYLLKENKEIKDLILEIVKNGTHNNITTNNNTNNTNNSHNKAFNLNFFLNETCKNAMNITDFIDSIKLQLSDFINMGEVGYIESMSNIIVNNLNSLDETIRPIHCTDQKREIFYMKDKNIWEKDDDDKKRLNQMIKSITYKNDKLMKTYKETYPDYNDPASHRSDQYSKIMVEAMDCKEDSREKIIKNISKATSIKKK
jgi:hypothetical protein